MSELGKLLDPETLEFTRGFPISVEQLWDYFTDPEKRAKWFCGGETEPRVGGRIVFDFDHRRLSDSAAPPSHADQQTVTFEGKVLAYEPPHHLAFDWPEEDGTGTKVEIWLSEGEGGSSKLRLVHSRLSSNEYRSGALAGWHAHFDLLADLAAGREARDFWQIYVPLEEKYKSA